MKNKNCFWGLFLLLAAVFVLASQIGSFKSVGVVTMLATVLLGAFFIQSVMERSFFGIFLSLAFLYMIYWKPLHLIYISSGVLLLAAVLMSAGLHMIFGKRSCGKWKEHLHKGKCGDGAESFESTSENIDDNNPYAKVSFGAAIKYLHADALKSGQFIVSFGAIEIFFDQAIPDPEGAEIFLDCSLGSIKLFVPKDWQVYDNLHVALGEVRNNQRYATPAVNAPKLTLNGNVQMGSVEILYI